MQLIVAAQTSTTQGDAPMSNGIHTCIRTEHMSHLKAQQDAVPSLPQAIGCCMACRDQSLLLVLTAHTVTAVYSEVLGRHLAPQRSGVSRVHSAKGASRTWLIHLPHLPPYMTNNGVHEEHGVCPSACYTITSFTHRRICRVVVTAPGVGWARQWHTSKPGLVSTIGTSVADASVIMNALSSCASTSCWVMPGASESAVAELSADLRSSRLCCTIICFRTLPSLSWTGTTQAAHVTLQYRWMPHSGCSQLLSVVRPL